MVPTPRSSRGSRGFGTRIHHRHRPIRVEGLGIVEAVLDVVLVVLRILRRFSVLGAARRRELVPLGQSEERLLRLGGNELEHAGGKTVL